METIDKGPNLPTYRGTRDIEAIKIERIEQRENQSRLGLFTLVGDGHEVIVSDIYYAKHPLQPGDYYVRTADGFEYSLTADVFDAVYAPTS